MFLGIMVAAMRTILEDILPSMDTDTDPDNDDLNDNDNDIQGNTGTDTHEITGTDTGDKAGKYTDTYTHSNTDETMRSSDRNPTNSSHNTQNNTKSSFEFYPHISPRLSDNWDFKSTLEAVTFPSYDSVNVAKWLKKRRKHAILKNCADVVLMIKENNGNPTNCTQQSEGDNVNFGPGDDSPVLAPSLTSTTTPTPAPLPTPAPVTTTENSSHDQLDSLTIQMGDFTKIYGHIDQENQFDCVVTCFFIDTASDILEYLAVIAHVLREGITYSSYV